MSASPSDERQNIRFVLPNAAREGSCAISDALEQDWDASPYFNDGFSTDNSTGAYPASDLNLGSFLNPIDNRWWHNHAPLLLTAAMATAGPCDLRVSDSAPEPSNLRPIDTDAQGTHVSQSIASKSGVPTGKYVTGRGRV